LFGGLIICCLPAAAGSPGFNPRFLLLGFEQKSEQDAATMILFFENLDNVFRVDPDCVGLTKENNDMKISWRAKLSGMIERVLRAVR